MKEINKFEELIENTSNLTFIDRAEEIVQELIEIGEQEDTDETWKQVKNLIHKFHYRTNLIEEELVKKVFSIITEDKTDICYQNSSGKISLREISNSKTKYQRLKPKTGRRLLDRIFKEYEPFNRSHFDPGKLTSSGIVKYEDKENLSMILHELAHSLRPIQNFVRQNIGKILQSKLSLRINPWKSQMVLWFLEKMIEDESETWEKAEEFLKEIVSLSQISDKSELEKIFNATKHFALGTYQAPQAQLKTHLQKDI